MSSESPLSRIANELAKSAETDFYMKSFGLVLDFSPGSVAALDAFITGTHGSAGKQAEDPTWEPSEGLILMCVQYGAYLGECILRIAQGEWSQCDTVPIDYFDAGVSCQTDQGLQEVLPVKEVLLRYHHGAQYSLFKIFSTFALLDSDKREAIAASLKETAARFEASAALPATRKFKIAADLYEHALQFISSTGEVERQYIKDLRTHVADSTPLQVEDPAEKERVAAQLKCEKAHQEIVAKAAPVAQKARALLDQKLDQYALNMAEQAIKIYQNQKEALEVKATALERLGDYEKAGQAWNTFAVRAHVDQGLLNSALCYEKVDIKRALKSYESFPKKFPEADLTLKAQAERSANRLKAQLELNEAESQNNGPKIFNALECLVQFDPDNRDARRKLAIMYDILKRDPAQSERLLQELIAQNPNDYIVINALALVNTRNGNPAEANKLYDEVLKIDPNNREAFLARLTSMLNDNRRDEVYSLLVERVKAEPTFFEAWTSKAVLEMFGGSKDEAKRSFESAITALEPGYDKDVLAQTNKDIWTLENPGATIDPSRAKAAYQRALPVWNEKKYKESLPDLKEAIQYDPLNYHYLNLACYAATCEGLHELCIKYSRVMQRLNPEKETGWTGEGLTRLKQKRFDDAIHSFEAAVKWAPKEFESWYLLCIGYRLAGRLDDALDVWTKARALANPEGPEFKKLINEQMALQNARQAVKNPPKSSTEKRGFLSRIFG